MWSILKEDIRVAFERDPAARNLVEVLLCYPGVHALLLHRLAHRLWRRGWRSPARLVSHLSRFFTGVEIHPGAVVGRRFFIDHGMGVVIGETSEIGDDCSIYHGVTLGGTTWQKGKRHPTLKSGVIIGAGAKVLGPITLGENARIGSNAVVVKDVPDNATVVGIPGRVIARESKAEDELKKAQREAMARKIGFDAYGGSKDMPDPVQNALDSVLDHMHKVDEEMEELKKKLEKDKSAD